MRPDYRIPSPAAVAAEQARRATLREVVRPQPGPQATFLQSRADIAIIGGSVYGGKTWSLVVDPLRHIHVSGFSFVIFRREMPDVTNPGGLWDESEKWYGRLGASPRAHVSEWAFPSGSTGKFSSLPYDRDLQSWLGAQICELGLDQLETFTEKMFWFMQQRNRSLCGVHPRIRASANPINADHPIGGWLTKLIQWWIDDDGWAIPEHSGAVRWFIRVDDVVQWSSVTCDADQADQYDDAKRRATADLEARFPGQAVLANGESAALSLTFVLARLQDNAIGRRIDPAYEARVRAMARVDRERLLGGARGGNWKVRAEAGHVFDRAWFGTVLEARPTDVLAWVRYWDKAGTQGGGKRSAGVLMGRRPNGRFVVADVVKGQWSALNRETVLQQTAGVDARLPVRPDIWVEQEPGSGGKESAETTVRNLAGHTIRAERVTGDKVTRAGPFSAQAEAGNVDLVAGDWNDEYLSELHSFDGVHGFMDQVDASSGAFNKLTSLSGFGEWMRQQAAQAGQTPASSAPSDDGEPAHVACRRSGNVAVEVRDGRKVCTRCHTDLGSA